MNSSSCGSRIIRPRSLACNTVPLAAASWAWLGFAGSTAGQRPCNRPNGRDRGEAGYQLPAETGVVCGRTPGQRPARRPVRTAERATRAAPAASDTRKARRKASGRVPAASSPGAQHVTDHVVGKPCLAPERIQGCRLDAPREFLALQLAIGQGRNKFLSLCLVHHITSPHPAGAYQRLPDWFSSMGLTLAEIASRARKIRERTVPIGQFITSAISS